MTLDDIRSALSSPITPDIKDAAGYRLASVLVVVYGQDPCIIMTKKSKHMRIHAGEVSFPGGKMDGDSDLLQTALRETGEEIGLTLPTSKAQVTGQLEPVVTLNSGFLILPFVSVVDNIPAKAQVTGQLEPVVTLNSGFLILPFVSVVDNIPALLANCEVEEIFHIPLEPLLQTVAVDPDPSHNITETMYTFQYQNHVVWGASARILKQIQTQILASFKKSS